MNMEIQGIRGTNLVSQGATPTENGQAPSLVADCNELVCGGDVGAAIAALAILASRDEREADKAARDTAEAAENAAATEQVEAIHAQASDTRLAGVVSGTSQIASGALNGVAAGYKLDSDAKLADANAVQRHEPSARATMNDKAVLLGDELRISADRKSATADSRTESALSCSRDVLQGSSKIVSALIDGAKADDHAAEVVAEHAASRAKRAVDDIRDDTRDAKQLLDKALEFYKEYTTTKDQTTAIASRRA
jgi:hypothetical protein